VHVWFTFGFSVYAIYLKSFENVLIIVT